VACGDEMSLIGAAVGSNPLESAVYQNDGPLLPIAVAGFDASSAAVGVAAWGPGVGALLCGSWEGLIVPTESRPTNACFGGPDLDTLYVTGDDLGRLVSIPTSVSGHRLPLCPSASEDDPWCRMLPLTPE